ncbi:VIR protein [Plasmodium vivax]|uniref:VIR protein n=1 Tax=Plasmodium vivax TaxID=5855 RepID=A0A1G4EI38_PLAVI|nr:VIR protein [Plasmodium vivax]
MKQCEEDFRSLKSHTYYKIFHSYDNVDTSNCICEQLKSVLSSNKDINPFCCKLSKNVAHVYRASRDSSGSNELCTYLNYWLYDALIKNDFLDNTENLCKSKVIKELSGLWNNFYNNNKCELEQYDMNVTDFNRLKVLYDYSQNYLGIRVNLDDYETKECKNLYCSYINKVNDVYNDVSGSCSPTNVKPYCSLFQKISNSMNPNSLFSEFNCSISDVDESLAEEKHIFRKELTSPVFSNRRGSMQLSGTEDALRDPYKDLTMEPSESHHENPPGSNPQKIGLSLLGMSLPTLILIYKFTPGGNLIRKLIRNKSGSTFNSDDISSGNWLPLGPEYQNDVLQNKRFEILYQAMKKN